MTVNKYITLFFLFSLVQCKTTCKGCKNSLGQEEVCCLLAGTICEERTWDATYCCVRHVRFWPQQYSKSMMF